MKKKNFGKKVRLGLIGAGNIADLHCSAIEKTCLGIVESVFDKDINAAERLQKAFPDVKIHKSLNAIIIDENVDVLVILVPPRDHYGVLMEILKKSNKDIFCEKPFLLDLKQHKKVIDIMKKEKRKIFVGQSYRYFEHIIKLKDEFLKNKKNLQYFEISFRKHIYKIRPLGGWRSKYKDYVVVDNGVHIIDLLLYLTGSSFDEVYSQAFNTSGVIEGFDTAYLNVKLKNGKKGLIILEHNNTINNSLYGGSHYFRFKNFSISLNEKGLIKYFDNGKEITKKKVLVKGPLTENWLDAFTKMWKSFLKSIKLNKEIEISPLEVTNTIKGVLMAVESAMCNKISKNKK